MSTIEETPAIQAPKAAPPGKKAKVTMADLRGQDLAQRKFGRKLIMPALIVAILVTQIPFIATIYYSFQDWNLARPNERSFAGFDNYIAVITNGAFLPSVWATIRIVGGSMILSLLLGLVLAVLLDREFKGRALARTLLITPFLVMPAAAALIWKYSLLEVNTGMVNWGLGLVGISPVAWNTDHPALTIVFTLTWQYTPFMMLILLAGLQSQAGEVLEAADVDGANAFQTFRFMTLPHLRSYAELSILLGTVFMIQVFDPINIMTKGAGNTKTIAYLLYERAFIGQQIGEAAAYGVITVILTIVFATLALRTMFSIFTEEAR
jgi:sorbitol/mannitol transport system permease protein